MNLERFKRKYLAEGFRKGWKQAMIDENTKMSALQYGRLLQKKAEAAGIVAPEIGDIDAEFEFVLEVATIAKDTPWNGNSMLDMGGYTSRPGVDIGDFENAIYSVCAKIMYGKIPTSGSSKERRLFRVVREAVSRLKRG